MYYLACGFCRWTTRDIGLPDQPVASGGWPEPENPDAGRFASLHEHFRSLAQKEKLEKETRRFVGKKLSYMQLADRYGLSGASAIARRKAGLPPIQSLSLSRVGGASDAASADSTVAAAPSEAKDIEEVESVDFKVGKYFFRLGIFFSQKLLNLLQFDKSFLMYTIRLVFLCICSKTQGRQNSKKAKLTVFIFHFS